MHAKQFAKYVRFKTKTNSTTFTDDEIETYMEVTQDQIVREAMKIDEDIFLTPYTTDLVADQREYPFPADILSRMKRLEAKLDETNFIRLVSMDMIDWDKPYDETHITNYFANLEGEAYYDVSRKSVYILSGTITDVTDGLRLWCKTYPARITDLTDTTDLSEDPSTTEHGMPRSLHKIWASMVIVEWKEAQEEPIPLTEKEMNILYRLKESIDALKSQTMDYAVMGGVPSGKSAFNDGFDL